jgi:hypothetical protein
LAAVLALVPSAVLAQAGAVDVERALLQRQQQQEEFSLRLRHFQQQSDPGLTPADRQRLELRQRAESQAQQDRHTTQMRQQETLQQLLPLLPESQQTIELQRQRQENLRAP